LISHLNAQFSSRFEMLSAIVHSTQLKRYATNHTMCSRRYQVTRRTSQSELRLLPCGVKLAYFDLQLAREQMEIVRSGVVQQLSIAIEMLQRVREQPLRDESLDGKKGFQGHSESS
jgi:hypothetical protein